jgi:hypothetical protein
MKSSAARALLSNFSSWVPYSTIFYLERALSEVEGLAPAFRFSLEGKGWLVIRTHQLNCILNRYYPLVNCKASIRHGYAYPSNKRHKLNLSSPQWY